jgi:Fur family ferric uptake transcriptional regulator
MTRQRQAILEALKELPSHPTAEEVYNLVKKRLPRISLGTVYRNLDALVADGVVRKIDTAGAQRKFDTKQEPHYHVRCIRCGAVDDVSVKQTPSFEDMVLNRNGYEIRGFLLEFTGLCSECLKASEE